MSWWIKSGGAYAPSKYTSDEILNSMFLCLWWKKLSLGGRHQNKFLFGYDKIFWVPSCVDRAERHDFWPRLWLFFSLLDFVSDENIFAPTKHGICPWWKILDTPLSPCTFLLDITSIICRGFPLNIKKGSIWTK